MDDNDVIDLTSPMAARIPFTDLTSPPCRPMRSLDDDDEEAILIFSSGEVPTNRAPDGVVLSTRTRRACTSKVTPKGKRGTRGKRALSLSPALTGPNLSGLVGAGVKKKRVGRKASKGPAAAEVINLCSSDDEADGPCPASDQASEKEEEEEGGEEEWASEEEGLGRREEEEGEWEGREDRLESEGEDDGSLQDTASRKPRAKGGAEAASKASEDESTEAEASIQGEKEEEGLGEGEAELEGAVLIDSAEVEELSKLKADELRRRLREHGLRGAGRRKVDMALMLANALRSQRMAPFPSQSTDRFSDRRGRCVSGRAVCVDMPRGPNGYVLCRVCQVEVPPPKVTFCSPACVHEHRLRTSGTYVRQCLRVRDKGVCALCGLDTEPLYKQAARLCNPGRWGSRAAVGEGTPAGGKGKGAGSGLEELQVGVDALLRGSRLEGKVRLRRIGRKGRKVVSRGLFWHADHILAVCEGGGLRGLDNFRTLCIACHHDVTLELRQRRGKDKAQARQVNASQEEAVLEEGEEDEGEEEEEEEEDSISSLSSSMGAPTTSGKAGVGAGDEGLIVIDEETETDDEA